MSRSNNTEVVNPAVRWFSWEGAADKGYVSYYDKTDKKNIEVKLPFTFLVLDVLSTVKGFDEANGCGIYSNEVRDITKDKLTVKSFKAGVIIEGLYSDIRDRIISAGADYTQSVYIAFKDDKNTLWIGNIHFKGAGIGPWIEFRKANRKEFYEKAVQITGYTEGKKGAVTFRQPVFALKDIDSKTEQVAQDLDKELQEYLNKYLVSKKEEEVISQEVQSSGFTKEQEDQMNAQSWEQQLREQTGDDLPF